MLDTNRICANRLAEHAAIRLLLLLAAALAVLQGCATSGGAIYTGDVSYEERVIRHTTGDVKVAASALGAQESTRVFGAPLNDVSIQPVWIEIVNDSDAPHWLFPLGVDADYFTPYEVSQRASRSSGLSEDELYERLVNFQIPHFIPPQTTHSGFVYTHIDEGMKSFKVELHSPREVITHSFVVAVPGMPHNYFDIDEAAIYSRLGPDDLDLDSLREWLDSVPCCTRNVEGKAGDPINVVFVGRLEQVRDALIARHWDVTAPVTGASLWRLLHASIFGSRYRYAPVSELFLFDRPHDLAFQKSRAIIDERNHMRLWLAPVTYQGRHVWLGQISRDAGVKFSGRLWPPTTHIIDPDIDEARFYLLQDLLEGDSLLQVGYSSSHYATTPGNPHYNAEDDPYFTDGLRAVFFVSLEPVQPKDLKILDWELPKALLPYRSLFVAD